MSAPAVEITAELVARRRRDLKMSREAFACLLGLTPAGVWRIETKGSFKKGEVEHLASIAASWLEGVAAAPPAPPQPPKSAPVKVVEPVTDDLDQDDLELVQWLDPSTLVHALQPSTVSIDFPLDDVSPEVLKILVGEPVLTLDRIIPKDQQSPTDLSEKDGMWRISNSEIQTFKRCRRKHWLAYQRGLRPRHEAPYGARAIGTRGHLALQAWYRPDPATRVDPRDALEAIIAEERLRLGDSVVGWTTSATDALTRFNKDAELERVIIGGYVQWLKETGADAEYEVIGSEQYLEARLPETDNVIIVARLDARLKRLTDGVRLFMDHKFVASIREAVKLLPLNEQMLFYILIENLQDTDERPVAGALYNMLRRVKRTQTATPPFYDRVEVHHNVKEIESFRKRLVGVLDDMEFVRQEIERGEDHHLVAYPTPTRDCAWDCPFVSICPMMDDGSRVEDAIEAHFVQGDPYGYYKTTIEEGKE